jgi:hypothetical protein
VTRAPRRRASLRTAAALAVALAFGAIAFVATLARAGEATTTCKPKQIAIEAERIFIQCTGTIGGIGIFAVPTADAANATRILSLLSTGQLYGDALSLVFDPDGSGAAFGCEKRDCRPLLGVVLRRLP